MVARPVHALQGSDILCGRRSEAIGASADLKDQQGVVSPGDKPRPIRGRSTAPLLRFPGPPVIHNMLMTLTLLIVAQQPDLKPCGARH